jgi:hypothetical protein
MWFGKNPQPYDLEGSQQQAFFQYAQLLSQRIDCCAIAGQLSA